MQNDSNPLPPWKARQPVDHKRLNAGERKPITELTVHPSVGSMVRNGNSVAIGAAKKQLRGRRQVLVRPTAAAVSKGVYAGVLLLPPTVDIPASGGDLLGTMLGTDGPPIRIVNVRERARPGYVQGHELSFAGQSVAPLEFPATFLRIAEDGVAVYAIDGLQWEDCVSTTQIAAAP